MQAKAINLMIPTYKRSGTLLPGCLGSFADQASDIRNIRFTLFVNRKDAETIEFLRATERFPDLYHVILADYDKPHLGWFYNEIYRLTKWQNLGTLVTLIGDDMYCHTKDWDLEVLKAVNAMDGMGIVHCRDGIQNGQIGVNLFTTRKWVDATGGTFMEDFPADVIDVIYTEVARRMGRETYLDHVFIEHRHNSLKPKEQWDEGFKALREQADKYGPDVTARAEACIRKQMTNLWKVDARSKPGWP